MKYVNLLIGVVVFSLVITLWLSMAGSIGEDYSSRDAGVYTAAAGTYEVYQKEVTPSNETGIMGKINNQLKSSQFSIVSTGVELSEQTVEGIKLMLGSMGTVERITSQVGKDLPIDPRIITAIKAIIGITLAILVLIMLWRWNPSTD